MTSDSLEPLASITIPIFEDIYGRLSLLADTEPFDGGVPDSLTWLQLSDRAQGYCFNSH